MKAYYAFLTSFAAQRKQPPIVKDFDQEAFIGALKSHSVWWVCQIQAETFYEAESEAKRARISGEGIVTPAGELDGFKLKEAA